MPIADYVNMKMGWNETNATATLKSKAEIEEKNKKRKNLRGQGAKDRGREGGNFSGDQQMNERGEYAFKNRENEKKISPYKKSGDLDKLKMYLSDEKEVKKSGETINEFRIQENAELQKMVTESNDAMASAVEQQKQMVASMASQSSGGGGQPEDVPIITPNFSQWNEADPFFVSKFNTFSSNTPDMHCTNKLK